MTEVLSKSLYRTIYILYHLYEYGENNEHEDFKMLGVYSTEKKALEAMERYFKLDGFNQYSKDCFDVEEFKVDIDTNWKDGFVNSDEIEQDFELLTNCFNEWLDIKESPQESWNNDKYYSLLCDVDKEVYNISDIMELAKFIQQIWLEKFNDNSKDFDDFIKVATNIRNTLKLI